LIVDDSAIMRRILMTALSKHDDINVIGHAENGQIAVDKVRLAPPDIITLDVEMPIMDGIAALKEIRKFNSKIPIVMFSAFTQRGAKATIDALTNGASDYVGKPTNIENPEEAFKFLDETLIPKIRSLTAKSKMLTTAPSLRDRGIERRESQGLAAAIVPKSPIISTPNLNFPKVTRQENRPLTPIDGIVIGVSTGGPAALMRVFELWKSPLNVPIFIVQHMPPVFTQLLANRLTDVGVIPVMEPYDGQEAQAGKAYIAPGGWHMALKRVGTKVIIGLNDDPPENSCRPAVDVLFRTAAQVYKRSLLGVVLTGMGQDGLLGTQDILRENGTVIVQDQETSVIWGMPGAIAKADLAEKILPLDEIPNEILYRTQI
jgi:two-component system chemotaxis response regulator CheB